MIKDLTAATPNAATLPKDVKVKLMTRQKELIKQAEYLQTVSGRRALCQLIKQKLSMIIKKSRFKNLVFWLKHLELGTQ